MNGRVYDPVLGRFLSPDPTVQFVANLQSYNRYSYVLNNPLSYTDPTGYKAVISRNVDSVVSGLLMVGGMAACAASGPVAGGICIGIMVASTAWNTAAMKAGGADWGQVIATEGIGLLVGFATGGVAKNAAFAGLSEKDLAALTAKQAMARMTIASLVSGAVSGALVGAASTAVLGGDLGANALAGAAHGAAGAMLSIAISAPVSAAASALAQGEGGGSGAARVETRVVRRVFAGYSGGEETVESVIAAAGYGDGSSITDEDLLNAYKPRPGSVLGADKLDTLAPGFVGPATRVVNRMVNEGYDVRVVWGRRTPEENEALVEKGLASPTSKHLSGNAVDLINRANPYPNDPANAYYLDLRDAVDKEGLVWGGYCWGDCTRNRWDPTHFEAP